MRPSDTCFACRATPAALQWCGACKVARYCNKACQIDGWREHGHAQTCAVFATRVGAGLWRQCARPLGVQFAESLGELPPEILVGLYGMLPLADMQALMAASRRFNHDLGAFVWHLMIERDVPKYLFIEKDIISTYDTRILGVPVQKRREVHPTLADDLRAIEAADWRSASAEDMFRLYERVMRTNARAMATEFACAMDYILNAQTDIHQKGLDRLPYVGLVHLTDEPHDYYSDEERATFMTTDESNGMSFEEFQCKRRKERLANRLTIGTTLFRLFQETSNKNQLRYVLIPRRKKDLVESDSAWHKRLWRDNVSRAFERFEIALRDCTADGIRTAGAKEYVWKPAYKWFVHVLQHVETTATLKMETSSSDGRKNRAAIDIFIRHYPEDKLNTVIAPKRTQEATFFLATLFKGLATGDTRLFYKK
jgi:hypothetical protein